jgi:hypothetical protein
MYYAQTVEDKFIEVGPHDTVRIINVETVWPKWYWWILALLLLWPVLFVLMFMGKPQYVVNIAGVEQRLHKVDWLNLQNYIYSDLRSV